MKTTTKIGLIGGIVLILAIGMAFLYSKGFFEASGKSNQELEDLHPLLSIQNLHSFYNRDVSKEFDKLAEHASSDQNLKSIKLYQYSTGYGKMLLDKEFFFDFKGKPVRSVAYSADGADFSHTYYFYNDLGQNYLDVYIGSNKYDTVYTFRNYNEQNHVIDQAEYNTKGNGLIKYTTWNAKLISDNVLRLEEIIYDDDLVSSDIVPSYKQDMHLTLISPNEVEVRTARTVYQDTVHNSHYEDDFKLENRLLVSVENPIRYELDKDGDWFTAAAKGYSYRRELSYYKEGEPELIRDFKVSKAVLEKLNALAQTVPAKAWKNHNKKHSAISHRAGLFKAGKYGQRIDIREAKAIDDFTPVLWHLVSLDSGDVAGFENKCFVAGYNTPLQDKDGFNLRCLAIYERVNGSYILRKQSFNAIETFNDYEDDFAYDGFNETNFSVSLEGGEVVVHYSYMRGEASYAYAYQDGNWVLVNYESSHRTCCQAEFYSYDYRTQMYHASIMSTTEDATGDTTINVLQNRPMVYMDSMDVQQYDYAETGLLIK
ncbi:hypothetical protein [Pontibacter ramchanderi]|uniref:Uncharacterized protein n=1 Tax=Pontibacter ramchanderi TaxID=1179743 RepID=A0A2N3UDG2_9BACT|nr:hypothetical protein [Pontibacter ramchanderi]PKV67420.1 hypothetical protein BD749_2564 [Pontibacter ramchanderi]